MYERDVHPIEVFLSLDIYDYLSIVGYGQYSYTIITEKLSFNSIREDKKSDQIHISVCKEEISVSFYTKLGHIFLSTMHDMNQQTTYYLSSLPTALFIESFSSSTK